MKKLDKKFIYDICKDQFWVLIPKDKWTYAQKAQNNEFVDSGLENWVLMNQTISKVFFDDKKMKIGWFNLKKKSSSAQSEDINSYISLKFDYKFQFLIVTVFLS